MAANFRSDRFTLKIGKVNRFLFMRFRSSWRPSKRKFRNSWVSCCDLL